MMGKMALVGCRLGRECVVVGDGKEVDREFPHHRQSPELLDC